MCSFTYCSRIVCRRLSWLGKWMSRFCALLHSYYKHKECIMYSILIYNAQKPRIHLCKKASCPATLTLKQNMPIKYSWSIDFSLIFKNFYTIVYFSPVCYNNTKSMQSPIRFNSQPLIICSNSANHALPFMLILNV